MDKTAIENIKSVAGFFFIPASFVFSYIYSNGNPFLTVVLGILLAVVGYFAGVLTVVMDLQSKDQAKNLSEGVQIWNASHDRRYKAKYFQTIHDRFFAFDNKSLKVQPEFSLDLQQVFVQLQIVPGAFTDQDSQSPLAYANTELHRTGDIWHFLQVYHQAQREARMAIIAPPGSGKSTLMRMTALTLADKQLHKQEEAPDLMPLLLLIREQVRHISQNPNVTLADLATQDQENYEHAPLMWFHANLKRGHFLVMFDGLDEVADINERSQIVQWIEKQMAAYKASHFIVTSRPNGYRDTPINGVDVLKVQPFNRQQQTQFVNNWYLANEIRAFGRSDSGVQLEARKGAQELLRRLHSSPTLSLLAINPLLLNMMATVHRFSDSLPDKRVKLYDDICVVFLGNRNQAKGLTQRLSADQRLRVLQVLAFNMMCDDVRKSIPKVQAIAIITDELKAVEPKYEPGVFLDEIEDDSGLILEKEQGVYEFAHLTFQEYLASRYIRAYPKDLDWLIQNIGNPAWRETILLYAARADATPILEACIRERSTASYALAMGVASEAESINPDVRTAYQTALEADSEGDDPERRRIVVEALLQLRLDHFLRIDELTQIDSTLVTQAEYQLFCNEMLQQGIEAQPDYWNQWEGPKEKRNQPMLGMRGADAAAFCRWLSEREPGDWIYRLPKPQETETAANNACNCWIQAAESFTEDNTYDNILLTALRLSENTSHDVFQYFPDYFRGRIDNRLIYFPLEDNFIIDRNSILMIARSLTTDRNLASVIALDLARAGGRDLAFARVSDLARASASDRASSLARANARVRASDLARDLAVASDLARDLALADELALARDLATALDRALARDRDRVSATALDHALDHARTLARELSRDRAIPHTLVSVSDHASAFDLALSLARNQAEADRFLQILLFIDLSYLRFFSLNALSDVLYKKRPYRHMIAEVLHWELALLAYDVESLRLEIKKSKEKTSNKKRELMQQFDVLQHVIEAAFKANYEIIKRQREEAEPFEGILLVKEFRPEASEQA